VAKVHGLGDFQRRWGNIPKSIRTNVRAEMEEVAGQIVAQMYGQAPQLTGDLAQSIGWTWGDAPEGALVIGTVGKSEYATMRITIYAGGGDTFYARFQEFGTVKMPANPFFYPVWRVHRRRVKGRISRALKKAIKEA
jgi:HK97 gp10 family phage protein